MKSSKTMSIVTHLCTPLLSKSSGLNEHPLLFSFRSTKEADTVPYSETILLFKQKYDPTAVTPYGLRKKSTVLNLHELIFPNFESLNQFLLCIREEESPGKNTIELQVVTSKEGNKLRWKLWTSSKAPPELHRDNYLRVNNHPHLKNPFFEVTYLIDSSKIIYSSQEYSPDWDANIQKSYSIFDSESPESYGTIVDFCFDGTTRKDDSSSESRIAVLCRKKGAEDQRFVIVLLKVNILQKSKIIKRIDDIVVSKFLSSDDRKIDYSRLLYCSEMDSYVMAGLKMDEPSLNPTMRRNLGSKIDTKNCTFGELAVVIVQKEAKKENPEQVKPLIQSSRAGCIFPEFKEKETFYKQQVGLIQCTTTFERVGDLAQFTANFIVQGSSSLATLELRKAKNTKECQKPILRFTDTTKCEGDKTYNDSGNASSTQGGIRVPHPITAISNIGLCRPDSKDSEMKTDPKPKTPSFSAQKVCINVLPSTIQSCNLQPSKIEGSIPPNAN